MSNRPTQERNQEHLDNPQPGDYWNEMMVPYHVVLKPLDNGNLVIVDKKIDHGDGYSFDTRLAREITRAEHERIVLYSSRSAFVADVYIESRAGTVTLKDWIEEGSPYLKIEDRPPVFVPEEIRNVDWKKTYTPDKWQAWIFPELQGIWRNFTDGQLKVLVANAKIIADKAATEMYRNG